MEFVGWWRENDKRHGQQALRESRCERAAMVSAGVGMCGGLLQAGAHLCLRRGISHRCLRLPACWRRQADQRVVPTLIFRFCVVNTEGGLAWGFHLHDTPFRYPSLRYALTD